jgi:hypothetical protein
VSGATVPMVRVVLKATELCPQIAHHVVRAGHDGTAGRLHNLERAQQLLNELAGEIELARAALRREATAA